MPPQTVESDVIGIRAASFTWSNENDGTLTPGPNRRNFTLRIEDEVVFKRGRFNLIVGPTGSGKTSLLMALLGELHYVPNGPESYVSLPRLGGVAYAAQESWVQNETIRVSVIRHPVESGYGMLTRLCRTTSCSVHRSTRSVTTQVGYLHGCMIFVDPSFPSQLSTSVLSSAT